MHRTALYASMATLLGMTVPAAGQAPPPLDDPGLLQYVSQVLEKNAALAADGADLQAAVERIGPAGALPDPTLFLGMMSVPVPSFDFDAENMTQLPIGIRQSFPFPGKQGARTAVARGDSALALARLGLTTSMIASQAAQGFFELAYARSALRLWEGRLQLADQAITTATARYETGRAPQADLLRAELRRARLEEERHQFAAAVQVAIARADALRGGPGSPLEVPTLAGAEVPAVHAVLADSLATPERLQAALITGNPALVESVALVDRARSVSHLYAIAARPDFSVHLQNGIRFGGREPFLSLVFGMSLPFWSGRKQAPAARAAVLDIESAQRRHEDLQVRLASELEGQLAELGALRERIRDLRDGVLPLAAAAATSSLGSYGAGELDLTAVLDAQDERFRAELRLAGLIASYGARRAALEALLGEEWYR